MKKLFSGLFLITHLFSGTAMAVQEKMGFSMNGFNSIDSQNSIGLTGDKFSLIFRGDTDSDHPMVGAGIFEGRVSPGQRAKFEEMRRVICATSKFPQMNPGNPGLVLFSVICPDGHDRSAALDVASAPNELAWPLLGRTSELIRTFYKEGTATTKLDASVSVEPKGDKLLFIVKFINSGTTEISFSSPATWEGYYDPIGKSSYANVGGYAIDSDDVFWTKVGEKQFLDEKNYPDGIIRIPPGQIRYAHFLAYPKDRFKRGRYVMNGRAVIKEMLEPEKLKGPIEFTFQDGATVEFEHDFPATEEDLNKFEAYRRERLWDAIESVDETVNETGYYRAYGDYGKDAARDDFPQLLRKGEKFPARTMEHREGGKNLSIGPATIWRWEAYPDAKISARSREQCPRSGCWIPSVPSGLSDYVHHVAMREAGKYQVAEGNLMPALGAGNEEQVVWTWIGGLTA